MKKIFSKHIIYTFMPYSRRLFNRTANRIRYPRQKRTFRRRRVANMRRMYGGMIPRNALSSFPKNKIVKMRYSIEWPFQSNAGSGTTNSLFISANNIYRPEQGGILNGSDFPPSVLRNALGYDQWAAFYERYCVLSSVIECSFTNAANPPDAPTNACIVGVQLTDDKDHIPDFDSLIENRATKYRLLQGVVNGNVINKQKAFYNAKRWHNVVDVTDCEELEAEFIVTLNQDADNAYPRDHTYYRVYMRTNDDTASTDTVTCRVVVTYTVLVKDANIIPPSNSVVPTTQPPP